RDREETRARAPDEEQRDDPDDEQPLRPVLERLDERDRHEAGKDVDDRLTEGERRERKADERHEERDVEREEHRERADDETGAGARVEPPHVWHSKPALSELPPPMTAEDLYAFRFVTDAQISPDGARVAYVVREIDREKNGYRSAIWLAASDGRAGGTRFTYGPGQDASPR